MGCSVKLIMLLSSSILFFSILFFSNPAGGSIIAITLPVSRIERDERHPTQIEQLFQQRVPIDNAVNPLSRRLDDGQQPHGFMIRHGPV
jgi:hypothetical protein